MSGKILVLAVAALLAAGCAGSPEVPYTIAHRGGHIDNLIPENSVAAVRMAARYGYRAIECDVHYTADSILVCMHDQRINRVMRLADGYEEIPGDVRYRDLCYDELRSKYVLASSDPSLRTPIASYEEILAACRECGITALLHTNEPQAYKRACEVLGPTGFIAFDVDYEALSHARDYSSDCLILWDPDRAGVEEVLAKLEALGGPCGISSMKKDLLTADYVRPIREAGYRVQASIFSMPRDIEAAENGCDIILSDFCLLHEGKCPEGCKTLSGRKLAEGESICWEWDETECGSIEMALEFTGEVEIQVCDDISYSLSGEDRTLLDGWRFYKKAPSFTLTAKKATTIKKLSVRRFSL